VYNGYEIKNQNCVGAAGDIGYRSENDYHKIIGLGGDDTVVYPYILRVVEPRRINGCTFREVLDAWRAKDMRLEHSSIFYPHWTPWKYNTEIPKEVAPKVIYNMWVIGFLRLRPQGEGE